VIILKQMSEAEYNIYASGSTDYAEALAKAQNIFLEKAKEEALKQLTQILPEGIHTKNHFLFSVFTNNLARLALSGLL